MSSQAECPLESTSPESGAHSESSAANLEAPLPSVFNTLPGNENSTPSAVSVLREMRQLRDCLVLPRPSIEDLEICASEIRTLDQSMFAELENLKESVSLVERTAAVSNQASENADIDHINKFFRALNCMKEESIRKYYAIRRRRFEEALELDERYRHYDAIISHFERETFAPKFEKAGGEVSSVEVNASAAQMLHASHRAKAAAYFFERSALLSGNSLSSCLSLDTSGPPILAGKSDSKSLTKQEGRKNEVEHEASSKQSLPSSSLHPLLAVHPPPSKLTASPVSTLSPWISSPGSSTSSSSQIPLFGGSAVRAKSAGGSNGSDGGNLTRSLSGGTGGGSAAARSKPLENGVAGLPEGQQHSFSGEALLQQGNSFGGANRPSANLLNAPSGEGRTSLLTPFIPPTHVSLASFPGLGTPGATAAAASRPLFEVLRSGSFHLPNSDVAFRLSPIVESSGNLNSAMNFVPYPAAPVNPPANELSISPCVLKLIEVSLVEKRENLDLSSGSPALREIVQRELDALGDAARFAPPLEALLSPLKYVPETVGHLTLLAELNFSGNSLVVLPDSVGELLRLTRLDASCNQLVEIPQTIGKCLALRELILNHNKIEEVPMSLSNCLNLIEFDVAFNCIKALPESFGQLLNLRRLSIQFNQFCGFPRSFGQLQNLTEVDAHFNSIRTIPESFGKLARLEKLNISGNHYELKALPKSFGELSGLKVLNISENQIKYLPESFGKLTNLTVLKTENNPWIEPPPVVVKQGLQAILSYMQLKAEDARLLAEEQAKKGGGERVGGKRGGFSGLIMAHANSAPPISHHLHDSKKSFSNFASGGATNAVRTSSLPSAGSEKLPLLHGKGERGGQKENVLGMRRAGESNVGGGGLGETRVNSSHQQQQQQQHHHHAGLGWMFKKSVAP